MNDEKQEQIERLAQLFEARERLYGIATQKIVQALQPTALAALTKMFEVSNDSVNWLDVQVVEDILVLVATIEYNEGQSVPEVIRALAPMSQDEGATVRLFRIGIPIPLVFQPPEQIAEYLMKNVTVHAQKLREQAQSIVGDEVTVPVVEETPSVQQFKTDELTPEQYQQYLYFSQKQTGIKH